MSSGVDEILSNLGRATRRGIRSCPQCGTLNGTRGLSCKNRLCDMVFKEMPEKRKRVNLDPCKLITESGGGSCLSSWTVTYSVKLKERGPDHVRGFVTLDFERENAATPGFLQLDPAAADIAAPSRGTCYVDGCPKRLSPVRLLADDNNNIPCLHVHTCLPRGNAVEAVPFTLKHSVLNNMALSADWKQNIWLKARRDGPLVQRVSKPAMVVKCDKDERHPLGYLHTTFLCNVGDSNGAKSGNGSRFGCTCLLAADPSAAKRKSYSVAAMNAPELHASNSSDTKSRCIHFYSCLAVFLGEPSLAKEFGRFVSDEQVVSSMQQIIAILGDDNGSIKVEVLDDGTIDSLGQPANVLPMQQDEGLETAFQIEMESEDGTTHTVTLPAINPDDILAPAVPIAPAFSSPSKRPRLEEPVQPGEQQDVARPLMVPGGVVEVDRPAVLPAETNAFPSQSSMDWLAGVTERINTTMHYGCSGKPEALDFLVPQPFFSFLMDRISFGSKKKRLPNSLSAFVRNEEPPRGTFTRYTWVLTNVLHVKQVFDTPAVKLDITRKFARTTANADDFELCGESGKRAGPEYKTFLKVGQMSANPKDVTPFVIEWVPDLLPRTKVGEMSIRFEFGHQKVHPEGSKRK